MSDLLTAVQPARLGLPPDLPDCRPSAEVHLRAPSLGVTLLPSPKREGQVGAVGPPHRRTPQAPVGRGTFALLWSLKEASEQGHPCAPVTPL